MDERNTIWLYGVIGSDEEVTAKGIRDDLSKANKSMSITLRINSPGGVVNEAVAIHTMLTEWRAGVDVRIDGIAASAASYLATLGRQVAIAREGLVMIHEPYGVTMGDSRDHRGAAERLDRVAESLVNAYVARTGRSREEIRTIMKAETWFTAQGAIEYGLADSIIGEEAEQAKGRTPRLNLATARLKLMESDARIAAMSSRY